MLIIDANCALAVFDPMNARHREYLPIFNFLFKRRGVIVTGGTKYLSELKRIGRALAAINELNRIGQVRVQSPVAVDLEEARVLLLAPAPACDDQHIIALVSVSGARVVASDDRRADRFLKDRDLYPHGRKRPFIYRKAEHKKILTILPTAK